MSPATPARRLLSLRWVLYDSMNSKLPATENKNVSDRKFAPISMALASFSGWTAFELTFNRFCLSLASVLCTRCAIEMHPRLNQGRLFAFDLITLAIGLDSVRRNSEVSFIVKLIQDATLTKLADKFPVRQTKSKMSMGPNIVGAVGIARVF